MAQEGGKYTMRKQCEHCLTNDHVCMYLCMYVHLCAYEHRRLWRPEWCVESTGTGAVSSFEWSSMGGGN